MVIDNAFDFVVYVGFITIGTIIVPSLSFRMIRKGISGVKKYGWDKFPKGFVEPYYGTSSFELMFGGALAIIFWIFLMYDFFSHRLSEIISYLS